MIIVENTMKKFMMLIVGGILSPALPLAAEEQTVNGVSWTYYIDGNTVEIAGATPATGHLTLPSKLGGKSVTRIGDFAFQDCRDLTRVTIPNSVTSIGHAAFGICSGLTSITIPNSVTHIEDGAFGECSGLTSVTVPQSGVDRFYRIFLGCRNLAVVVISDGVTCIGEEAFVDFSGSGSLKSVTIPKSVTNIGRDAFRHSSGLRSISIPNGVTKIRDGTFSGCSGLMSVMIPNSVTSIEYGAFRDCIGLRNVVIPNSVTNIGEEAFSGCSNLTSMTIPNNVMAIGRDAFRNCSGLTSVTLSQLGVNRFGDIFPNCRNMVVEISNGVTYIGEYAFYECSGLRSVNIPNSVTNIGEYAFFGCTGLTSVTIPNCVTSVKNFAFSDCSGLTNVIFKGNAPTLGSYAFDGVNNRCTAYVRENSSGWGVDIPGTWNGLSIRFLTPEVEITVANEMGGGTVEFDGYLSTVEVASGVTLVVRGENLDAAALAAKITPMPHEEEQSSTLFKVARSTAAGSVSLSVVLDEDAIDPDEAAREVISTANMAAFSAAADGETVSVPLSSAKPGLYYGIAAVNELSQMDVTAANVPLVRADAGGVTVPVVKPVGSSAFFKVIVSDRAW